MTILLERHKQSKKVILERLRELEGQTRDDRKQEELEQMKHFLERQLEESGSVL